MKTLLFAALLLAPFAIAAQTVKLENDTIYKNGDAYGLLIKTGKMSNATYSVKTLTNVEIAVVKFDEATKKPDGSGGYFRFTFLGSGAFGHFTPGLNVPKGIATAVVENDLIKNNALNPEGEKRFLAVNPNKLGNQPNVVVNINNNNAVDYTPVQRSRSGIVNEVNGQISQGGVKIGTCSTVVDHSGKSTATISYFLPSNVKVAEATCDNIGAKTAAVVTMKDNNTHTVTITNSAVKEQEIAKYLVENGYL